MASFFGFGLLLSFTPCVLPMIPILSGMIAGQGARVTRWRGFTLSVMYVLGMAIAYAIAGVLAGLSGTLLSAALQNPWVLGAFAGIFVLLALSMFGFYELQLPSAWQSGATDTSNRLTGGTLAGVFAMGALSAVIVGPCVAAPLAGALLYVSQSRDVFLGGAALFMMALGMGLPLLAIGASAGALLPKAGAWMQSVKNFFRRPVDRRGHLDDFAAHPDRRPDDVLGGADDPVGESVFMRSTRCPQRRAGSEGCGKGSA